MRNREGRRLLENVDDQTGSASALAALIDGCQRGKKIE
jgi:hypothetical protein